MYYQTAISNFKTSSAQEEADKKTILMFIKKNDQDVLLRENKIAHLTSSAMIFNEAMDKVLMVYHNIYRSWSWTGGHADGDEDLLYVAIKEAKEETGLKQIKVCSDRMVSLDILPVFGHLKNNKPVSVHLHLSAAYVLQAQEDESVESKPDENSGVLWIPIKKLTEYVNEPHVQVIYDKILNKVFSQSFLEEEGSHHVSIKSY